MCVLGNQGGFTEHGQKDCKIESSPPDPMPRVETRRLLKVSPEQDDRKNKQNLSSSINNYGGNM